MDNAHKIRNIHDGPFGDHLDIGEVYEMHNTTNFPTVKILSIHSAVEGCFRACGMTDTCSPEGCYTHFVLVKGVEPLAPRDHHGLGDTWVYHVTDGHVDWLFVRDEKYPSPWMRAFVKSSRGLSPDLN